MRVVVIGSGLLGLSTAYFLTHYGIDVVVVDRARGPALETSFANGGLLSPSMASPWNSPGVLGDLGRSLRRSELPLLARARALPSLVGWGLRFLRESNPQRHDRSTLKNVRLALYSQSVLQELLQQIDLSCDYVSSGSLRIFRDADALRRALLRAHWLQQHGIASKLLDTRETAELEPALTEIQAHVVGGIHYPNDAVGDARRFCEGLAAALKNAGAELSYSTLLLGWKHKGRRIRAALTNNGLLPADAFVLAAGSASRALTRSLGFDLPIRPVKGYSITLSREDWSREPHIPVIDDTSRAVVVPVGRHVRVAGLAEFAGFNLDIPPARIDNLQGALRNIYPRAYAEVDPAALHPWAGLRPVSADGVPILGGTPFENLYVNTGHGHLGWTLAAGSGKAVADLLAGRPTTIDMTDYALASKEMGLA